jgi:hypothetical protein
MKAVAAALVLIAGAAVVLWYGNTLNSWVLGGLIGGLAALLLSIPISLTLFSYLSRRHDERLRAAQAEEEMALEYEYPEIPARATRRAFEVEGYTLQEESEELFDEEEEYYRQVQESRNLPALSPQRLPARQGQDRLPAPRRGGYAPATRPQSRNLSVMREKDAMGRRTTGRRMNYPGFPGYEPGSALSRQRSAALRAARMEAAQQYQDDDDIEMLPTNVSRRLPPTHSQLTEQRGQATGRRPSRQLSQQMPAEPRYRPRRTVDATPSQNDIRRSLPAEGESSARRSPRYEDPQTEYLQNNYPYYPHTGPVRQPPTRQTGQIPRHPQGDGQPDVATGSLRRPLVRRAPYMYEDDPLRQEMAQQIDRPTVRRSSRLGPLPPDDEDAEE